MVWNLFLAAVPLVLAVALFSLPMRRGSLWWTGFLVWLLFLPNAPYVLTDVVHMVDDLSGTPSRVDAYEILALYAVFFAAGLVAYVIALQLFRSFLHRNMTRRMLVAPILVAVHALRVIAMYVGRVLRFNSWDALVAPFTVLHAVARVPRPSTVVLLGVMFAVTAVAAFVTYAVGERAWRAVRSMHSG
jgi:uncharacterized membrane protein